MTQLKGHSVTFHFLFQVWDYKYMVSASIFLKGISILTSIVADSIDIPNNSAVLFLFLPIILFVDFFVFILTGVRYSLDLALQE